MATKCSSSAGNSIWRVEKCSLSISTLPHQFCAGDDPVAAVVRRPEHVGRLFVQIEQAPVQIALQAVVRVAIEQVERRTPGPAVT